MARTCAQNGTEKDSQEGLKMESSGERKQGEPKTTLRKTFEVNFKKMELTRGTAERKRQKSELYGEKGVTALSLMDRSKEKRRKNL